MFEEDKQKIKTLMNEHMDNQYQKIPEKDKQNKRMPKKLISKCV